MMNSPLRVAIAGLGTVGSSVVQLIEQQQSLLQQRCHRAIKIVAVSARQRATKRVVSIQPYQWYDNPVAMASEAEADVIVELIGGAEGVAKSVCEAALNAGKHLVTANKALLAHHGVALATLAEAKKSCLGYEAAVAGGIPVIKALCEGGSANKIGRLYGILNGTCNYILTTMAKTGRPFDDVLREAQALGYAEADPSFDIDGIDTAHKLAILASLAFGVKVDVKAVHCEGIRGIEAEDVQAADALGYTIKLLGIGEQSTQGVLQRVHPCLVPSQSAIGHVDDVYNAVVFQGDYVGNIMLHGRGAGGHPTASSVVADIVDIANNRRAFTFGMPVAALQTAHALSMATHEGCYYVRLTVNDAVGVVADVAAALRDAGVSIRSLHQHDAETAQPTTLIIVTHPCTEGAIQKALATMQRASYLQQTPQLIRIETV